MTKSESLKKYREKRDFNRSSEPFGDDKPSKPKAIFVIHKHDARNLHYDFRIEVKGVLKSWAVPKGPSTDPREKRLALPTEDHPLEYADFEGTIPEDEYGAGTVMVWDAGTYRNLKTDANKKKGAMTQAIKAGHVTIWLEGKKLKGGYALIRTEQDKNERWLLVKTDDDKADARRNPVSTEPKSVLTGRTLAEIRKETTPKSKDSESR
ncbi:DNA ligase [candidate division KSB1 bacterium]|nr:DNA ligase [candidate division KSB1 bacterium]